HGGGVRTACIVHWPAGIQSKGEIRGQFHHVIDVLPTVLDCAGVRAPEVVNGHKQIPIHGVSMRYSFDNASSPSTRQEQYFELIGNRAMYREGWKVVAAHEKGEDFDKDDWELYCLDEDFSEVNELSATYPEKVRELVGLWWQ